MAVIEVEAPPVEQAAEPKNPVLAKALEILRTLGWAQNDWYSLDGGRCLVAAINEAAPSVAGGVAVIERHLNELGFGTSTEAIRWNDKRGRTWSEVEDRLERAAYGL